MFTYTQGGADAAALGVLAPLRDQQVQMLLQGQPPDGAGYWLVTDPPTVGARKYAEENKTEVVSAKLSGMLGDNATVKVRSRNCQLKKDDELTSQERDDLRHRRNLCTDNQGKSGIGRFGTAGASAKIIKPDCIYTPKPPQAGDTGLGPMADIWCTGNGRKVHAYPNGNFDDVREVFKIRLVDKADGTPYTGEPQAGFGPTGGAGVAINKCAKDKSVDIDSKPFGERVVAWALCWQGTPYSWGGGTYSGPSFGICCSPGGYSGASTLGFDCSGLTLYAVYQASKGRIALGHFTGNQQDDSRGIRVPLNALQPGDLVFFGLPVPHHVAIYYGDNQIVEAPQTGDVVKISPLAGRGATAARRFG
ncbi:peptidoglycan endopeptidase [Actinomadura logoneensis]|uniref:Peptidoglycan endopeptidase n=2 Tax=Actinomadura logoneensis TaxID=2293572 RepID=A0A372JLB3_9ACTN|nr:peptidoglycan endopeptidase [Actinomadura logoneensis]